MVFVGKISWFHRRLARVAVAFQSELAGLFLPIGQPNRCLEINREISTIDVFPVNSNLTFPNEEK